MQIGDMSLADNATLCLSAVITQMAALNIGEQTYRDVVVHTILAAVLKGLRSKTEVTHSFSLNLRMNLVVSLTVDSCSPSFPFPPPLLQSVQHDYTSVLACLVKIFPSKKEFRDLVQLTNNNDPESDFFEHMKHIQVRARPWFSTFKCILCTTQLYLLIWWAV